MNSTLSSVASAGAALAVLGVFIYVFFFKDDSPTRKVVFINQELGVSGQVTGFNKARGFKIYLNSTDVPYNFDAFVNEQVAPHDGLGYYLEPGDFVTKQPNSTTLTLKRKGQESEWKFTKPAPQN